MKIKNNKPRTLKEIKKEKSRTNWGKVLSENESSNKTIQPTQKTRG